MTDLRENIQASLADFQSLPLADAARRLFGVLGYESERTISLRGVKDFLTTFDPQGRLTPKEQEALSNLSSLHLLFQLSDAELTHQSGLFDSKTAIDGTLIQSYLFFAAELPAGHYNRTTLSNIARAINKPLPMPALVLIRHGDSISLAIVHRRLHKREQSKDVLEKVTLIKDIALADPIRAHLEILGEFSFDQLRNEFGVHNFVSLHRAWEKRLGTFALNERFYREIADWYFAAQHLIVEGKIIPPRSVDTDPERSLFLIRLLTRLIFCWFLLEKRLLPRDLFKPESLCKLLHHFDPEATDSGDFYRAVLQNLFFATLNRPVQDREFRGKSASGNFDPNRGSTNLYRYADRFRDPAKWKSLVSSIPFLNGGLFECLDQVFQKGEKTENVRLDDFSEEKANGLLLPDALFFGSPRPVDLSGDYGDDKKSARSRRAEVRGLIEIFSRYKFTIEENTPLEEEIALDPELLGKVFENLLASYNPETRDTARKQTGSFYTPREVVSYMVDEALLSYLQPFLPTNDSAERLRQLFNAAPDASIDCITPAEKDRLIRALDDVKILDPACGSGAFPMGALHRLVDLLRKLDPGNGMLKSLQLAKLQAYPAEDQPSARLDIEDFFDEERHDPDYARKICLIENSIFGVDIELVAVQIAKLRFFIALICDQKTADNLPNRGVKPLPNLETRIVAANTLIPIEGAVSGALKQADLLDQRIDSLRAALRKVRHDHFSARDPSKKRKCRERDAELRKEIATILRQNGLSAGTAKDLADNDPYSQNISAPFFDPVWMFGSTYTRPRQAATTLRGEFADIVNSAQVQGELAVPAKNLQPEVSGFEIVIGNPPYVRQEKIKDQKEELQKHYQCFTGTADLYVYFYERALQLLRQGGVLSFITSNKWYRAAYGEKLRVYLGKQTTLLSIIDFGDASVFTAIAYPTIVILRKGTDEKTLKSNRFSAMNWDPKTPNSEIEHFAKYVAQHAAPVAQSALETGGWRFLASKHQKLLEHIRAAGVPLGEFVKGRLYRGILTGLNEAFVVDRATRDRLIAEDPKSAEVLKPFLRGRDVKRWRVDYADLWLVFTRRGINIDSYPAIKEHLSQFQEQLEPRPTNWPSGKPWPGRKPGSYHWFEVQDNSAYWEEFLQPKVLIPSITDKPNFAADMSGFFSNNKTSFAVTDWPILVASLCNSPVGEFFARHTYATKEGGFLDFEPRYSSQFPIADHDQAVARRVSTVGLALHELEIDKSIQDFPRDPLMRSYYEQVLNALVYELYFPEEMHDAGLRIFDLVGAATLPDLATLPADIDAKTKLRLLREKFEEIYDPRHSLRAALGKLQSLDIVRIIEGKA